MLVDVLKYTEFSLVQGEFEAVLEVLVWVESLLGLIPAVGNGHRVQGIQVTLLVDFHDVGAVEMLEVSVGPV